MSAGDKQQEEAFSILASQIKSPRRDDRTSIEHSKEAWTQMNKVNALFESVLPSWILMAYGKAKCFNT